MLFKLCRCGAIIPQSMQMCERCAARRNSRHMRYNAACRDKEAAAFYISHEWRTLRSAIIPVFSGIDIWALYIDNTLLTVDEVHHIEELRAAWDRRLDPLNLIPLAHNTHTTITALYKASEASMKRTQGRIYSLIERHFADRGGIDEVLQRAGLVAPPSSVEKTPH